MTDPSLDNDGFGVKKKAAQIPYRLLPVLPFNEFKAFFIFLSSLAGIVGK
jgi:hypothetical protein